jgi:hypothetical protein
MVIEFRVPDIENEGHGFVKKENEIDGYGKLLVFLGYLPEKIINASQRRRERGGNLSFFANFHLCEKLSIISLLKQPFFLSWNSLTSK